jgi:maltose alpha-D-glucosyltransferase/alpha-amylase
MTKKLWTPQPGRNALWLPPNRYPKQYPLELLQSIPWWAQGAAVIEWPFYAGRDSKAKGIGDIRGFMPLLRLVKSANYRIIWFPPYYPSGGTDRGYDITDYKAVDPRYGTLEDFKRLLDEAHKLGLRVLTDLVPGHTSTQHPFFQASRSNPDGPYGDWYIWDKEGKRNVFYYDEHGVRHVVRNILIDDPNPRMVEASDGLLTPARCWKWDTVREAYFWHRFKDTQPNLNYNNPDVVAYMDSVIDFWLELGVDGFRVDAVPFLYEEDGTPSENHPLVHGWIRHVKARLDANYPDAMLLCESDLPEEQMAEYSRPGEFDAFFDFPGRIERLEAMRLQDATPIEELLRTRATQARLPIGTVRYKHDDNHDDARPQWKSPEFQRNFRAHYGDGRRGEKFVGDAVVGDLAQLLDWDPAKFDQMQTLRTIFPGVCIDYYRQLIQMGHHPTLAQGYGRSDDARDGVRTFFHFDDSPNAGASKAHPRDLYLPVVDEGRGSYQIVNLAAQRWDPRSPFRMKQRHNYRLMREPLLAFGDADVLTEHRKEQVAVIRWYEGVDRIIVAVYNLNHTKSTNVRTRLPNDPWFRRFRGARLVDWASGELITTLGGRDGLGLTVAVPPLSQWMLVAVANN